MMSFKKMAVFVEGQTEAIFVKKFLLSFAGEKKIYFDVRNYSEDRSVSLTQSPTPASGERFFVLIFDCQNDDQVKTVIKERRGSLESAGYELIVGIRDLYPLALADYEKLKRGLAYGMPTSGVPTHLIIAVAEVEAWFLQNAPHYSRIDPLLNVNSFATEFGFDPDRDSAEGVAHPSNLLDTIYRSVGKRYRKKRRHVERTVDKLCFETLCLNCNSIPAFERLLGIFDRFFV